MRGLILTIALMIAPAAQAQSLARLESAIAETVIAALPPAGSNTAAYEWRSLESRWAWVRPHFTAPFETSETDHFIWRGWMSVGGDQADFVACGGEQTAMAFALKSPSYDVGDALGPMMIAELQAQGAVVTPRETPDLFDVTAPGREGVLQVRTAWSCTSPMSAAAQRCWTDIQVVLPSRSPDSVGAAAAECSASRRYYSKPSN